MTVPLRVLFVNENLGGHRPCTTTCRGPLAEHDVDVRSVDMPAPGMARRIAGAAVPGLGSLDLDLQPLRFQLAQSVVARRAMRRELGRGVDALHVYTHNVALLSTDLLRSVPSVVSLDGTNTQNAYRLPYRKPTRWTPLTVRATRPFERRVYEAASMVVTHSAWAAESVRSYGIDADRIEVIPFGVTVPVDVAPRERDGRPRIVFVGRSMERKGGWDLVRMHEEALRGKATLELVTMDPVAPMPDVRVHDDVVPGDGRVEGILAACDIFAFPSEMDLSPNAVLEAMASGLPVVAYAVGGISEMVDDGRTGLLVRAGDKRGFADACRRGSSLIGCCARRWVKRRGSECSSASTPGSRRARWSRRSSAWSPVARADARGVRITGPAPPDRDVMGVHGPGTPSEHPIVAVRWA